MTLFSWCSYITWPHVANIVTEFVNSQLHYLKTFLENYRQSFWYINLLRSSTTLVQLSLCRIHFVLLEFIENFIIILRFQSHSSAKPSGILVLCKSSCFNLVMTPGELSVNLHPQCSFDNAHSSFFPLLE